MKKIKSFFYFIYIAYFVFSACIAVWYKGIMHLAKSWHWGWLDTWAGLIRFVLWMGAIGSILFIFGVILENIHLFTKNKKIKSLEMEVLNLKAKLYDEANDESAEAEDDTEEGSASSDSDPDTSP